jgi:elongation factor G
MAKLRVAYRETVTRTAEARGKHVREGEKPRYGDVALRVEPLGRGAGFEFSNAMEPDRIPARFVPDVVQGIYETAEEGVFAGFPIVDMRVVLVDGSYHEYHSSPLAFRIAASIALRDAVLSAEPIVLSPVAKVELAVHRLRMNALERAILRHNGLVIGTDELELERFRVRAVIGLPLLFDSAGLTGEVEQGEPSLLDWHGGVRIQVSHYERAAPELQQRLVDDFSAALAAPVKGGAG